MSTTSRISAGSWVNYLQVPVSTIYHLATHFSRQQGQMCREKWGKSGTGILGCGIWCCSRSWHLSLWSQGHIPKGIVRVDESGSYLFNKELGSSDISGCLLRKRICRAKHGTLIKVELEKVLRKTSLVNCNKLSTIMLIFLTISKNQKYVEFCQTHFVRLKFHWFPQNQKGQQTYNKGKLLLISLMNTDMSI